MTGSGIEDALLGPAGFFVAFLVGVVACLSPCVLPLLPGYVSFVGEIGAESVERPRRRVVLATMLFIAGFAVVFAALGASASAFGSLLLRHLATINRVAGVVVIVMGLAFLMPRLFPFLERENRPFMRGVKPGMAGAFPLGMAFAVGWTPCVGPGLGVMLTLAAQGASVVRGTVLLVAFSLGFGVWFLVAALGAEKLLRGGWFRRNLRRIQIAGGVMMVTIGVLLVTDQWSQILAPLIRWTNRFVPTI